MIRFVIPLMLSALVLVAGYPFIVQFVYSHTHSCVLTGSMYLRSGELAFGCYFPSTQDVVYVICDKLTCRTTEYLCDEPLCFSIPYAGDDYQKIVDTLMTILILLVLLLAVLFLKEGREIQQKV